VRLPLPPPRSRPRHPSGRRGNYTILFALTTTTLISFAAFAIDLPYAGLVSDQLQSGVDAAAHAAVMRLDGTEDGMADAEETALAFANHHKAGTSAIDLSRTDVRFGAWVDGAFVEEIDPRYVTAVHIETRVPVASLVGDIVFERGVESVQRASVGKAGGASAVECFLPIAVPTCLIDSYGRDGAQQVDLVVNPPGSDNVGWARPVSKPSARWTRDHILDCTQEGELAVSDEIKLNNGSMDSALREIARSIEAPETTWDAEVWGPLPPQHADSAISAGAYGGTHEGVVALFEDPTYCGGSGRFNESQLVVGFTWAAIYDVVLEETGADPTIRVRLETNGDHRYGTENGGVNYGVQAPSRASIAQ